LVTSSISGQVEIVGVRRIVSMESRNTCAFFGGFVASRNASDRDTSMFDGTVRPVAAMVRWPSGPSAYRTKSHAASCRPEPLVTQ
jgi:hypothetical protein